MDLAACAIFSPVVNPGKSWMRIPPCHGEVEFSGPDTVFLQIELSNEVLDCLTHYTLIN